MLFACTCSSGIVWEGIQSCIDSKLKYQQKYFEWLCTTHRQNRQSLQHVINNCSRLIVGVLIGLDR